MLTITLDGEAVRRQRSVQIPSLPSNTIRLVYMARLDIDLHLLAVEHLMTYWAILEKVKGSQLRLTKMDDEIYESFKAEFPDFDPSATINEDQMKSKAGKEKWRNWVNQYEKKIEDFNFGTIIRTRADAEYDQDTTIFGG